MPAPGDTVGPYTLDDKIGEGGMGEVYRATDTKLKRDVALKFLPEAFTLDPARLARFQREAELLAQLQHPNIASIYGLEESEGHRALVMELVEGPSLAELLERGTPTHDEAFGIARQIAAALDDAHAKGIVHRDLKPANVKVRPDGTVKVLDFGLAKRTSRAALPEATTEPQPLVTAVGSILGTFPYMAPEQLRGLPADERSDIWAFGVLLYELVTGARPFRGATAAELSSAILNEPPPPLPGVVPARWRAAIERCLAKDPVGRFQRPHEVVEALSGAAPAAHVGWIFRRHGRLVVAAAGVALVAATIWWLGSRPDRHAPAATTAAGSPAQSLAVLPLVDLSGDPEQAYFAVGMTDALTSGLGRLAGLRVISRHSASRYAGTDKSLPEISAELGVDLILEGSVLREGERVRVTVELVRAETDSAIWTENFEHEMVDVLSVQSDVAAAVAREVDLALTPGDVLRLSTRRVVDPETYEAYLRGMYRIHEGRFDEGIAFLQDAVARDPADPLAYAGLALGYANLGHGPGNPDEAFPRARAAAVRALELDDTVTDAHLALADVSLYYDWNWETAGRAFRRALELNPNSAEAHYHYGWYLGLFDRSDEATAEFRRAEDLDPLTPKYSVWVGGWYYCCTDQIESAVRELERTVALHPNSALAWRQLSRSHARLGRLEEALAAHRRAVELNPGQAPNLALIYAIAGREEEARRLAAEAESAGANPSFLAMIYAELDDGDAAFRWLQAAFEKRYFALPWIHRLRSYDRIRDDPRFEELLKRIDVPR